MNGNSLDLNTSARAYFCPIVGEDCNEFAIELNCITHSCQQSASHSIRLNPIEIDFDSVCQLPRFRHRYRCRSLSLSRSLPPSICLSVFDVTLRIDTLWRFVGNLKCASLILKISSARQIKFKWQSGRKAGRECWNAGTRMRPRSTACGCALISSQGRAPHTDAAT